MVCPKRRPKGDKPAAKGDRRNADLRATLAASESTESSADQTPVTDSALSALFLQEESDITFSLDATGRALCLHATDSEP
eukprot:1182571-Pleurochrysis_carterae.AAC.1